MISFTETYYALDMKTKVGDLVVLLDGDGGLSFHNPTLCRVISLERPLIDHASMDYELQVQCINSRLSIWTKATNVLRYETFLIFSVMGMFGRLAGVVDDE